MKNNILFGSTFFIALLLMSFVSAECTEYGVFKQNTAVSLVQTCTACNNITASITYPDSTSTGLITFQNIDGIYNYTFSDTTQLGTYNVIGKDAWCYSFEVNSTGEEINGMQSLGIILACVIIAGLLFFSTTLFAKEQKGIKTLLIMFGIGFILLTMQIAKASVPGLEGVMNAGLIMGLVLLMFMLFYFMIMYTKDIFYKLRNAWKTKHANSFGEVVQ